MNCYVPSSFRHKRRNLLCQLADLFHSLADGVNVEGIAMREVVAHDNERLDLSILRSVADEQLPLIARIHVEAVLAQLRAADLP